MLRLRRGTSAPHSIIDWSLGDPAYPIQTSHEDPNPPWYIALFVNTIFLGTAREMNNTAISRHAASAFFAAAATAALPGTTSAAIFEYDEAPCVVNCSATASTWLCDVLRHELLQCSPSSPTAFIRLIALAMSSGVSEKKLGEWS